MTRQACFLAGLITTIDSMQLLMCLEPEAATLQVKHQGTGFEAKDGQVFTVCDCGGGTIDISTFKVLPGGGMAEVIPSSGAFAGSTYVDQEFLEWFKVSRLLPPEVVTHLFLHLIVSVISSISLLPMPLCSSIPYPSPLFFLLYFPVPSRQ
jgi:hypothetical protein